jgi:hypothetical protein
MFDNIDRRNGQSVERRCHLKEMRLNRKSRLYVGIQRSKTGRIILATSPLSDPKEIHKADWFSVSPDREKEIGSGTYFLFML